MSPSPSDSNTSIDDDRALFERLATDPTAIGEIYDRYAKTVYAFCLKRCGHKQTAEDIVSQTFMKLLESAKTLEYRGIRISAWLFRVASNVMIDYYRKSSTKKEGALEDPETWDPPSDDDPAWNTELTIESEALRSAMDDLPERDQHILTLRFYGGLEPQEIAAAMSISANHASVLVYRAVGRLRQRILERRPAMNIAVPQTI
jgi:RNA polymerase sigma-70 factor (ECF subfamily)